MSFHNKFYLNYSGVVQLQCPSYNNRELKPSQYGEDQYVTGILQDDPQIQMGNDFTTLSELSDALGNLQDFQTVAGANNLVNYIPASAMTWQGTAPIKVNLAFYLITFNKDSNIQGRLKILAEMATLDVTGDLTTRVHGGYRFMYYNIKKDGNLINNEAIDKNKDVPGTFRILINNRTCLTGMLLTSLQFQPSTVVCKNKEPLYYIVNASFVQYRPPIRSDLDSVFGGIV